MPLSKYKFNSGDAFPAVNANSIDPNNIVSQASGFLTGGASVSALSVFQSLANGANNGKIKINIDGVVYDNVGIDLKAPVASPTSLYTYGDSANVYAGNTIIGSWTTNVKFKLTNIIVVTSGGLSTIEVRVGGVLIATSDSVSAGSGAQTDYTFSGVNSITIESGVTIDVTCVGTTRRTNNFGYTTYWNIRGKLFATVASFAEIATVVQTAIRTLTGKLETCVYSTDKFVISSTIVGRASQVLKFMTPTTGTDVSGNNAIKYLDCAGGATETLGAGDEFYLVRLNGESVLAVPIKNNQQVGTSYTLDLPDAFKYVVLTNASAIALTVPTNAVKAFPIGTEIYLIQGGAGKVTLSGAGVTINSLSSYKSIAGAGGQATLVKIATDTWQLYGNLIA